MCDLSPIMWLLPFHAHKYFTSLSTLSLPLSFIHVYINNIFEQQSSNTRLLKLVLIQKLCNVCYGNHLRKNCTEEKLSWADYNKIFRSKNPEIPDEFYGKWIELIRENSDKMLKINCKKLLLGT